MKICSGLFLASLVIPMAHATVAFTTNTAAQPTTPLNYASVLLDTGNEAAQSFTATATGFLTSLTVGVSVSNNATTRSLENFFIYDDNGGAPGTLLEEIENVDVGCSPVASGICSSVGFDLNGELATADSAVNPLLTSGQTYWVGLQAVSPSNNPVDWWWGDINSNHGTDILISGTWDAETPTPTDPYSLEVDVQSTIPEPSTLLIVSIGVALLFIKTLRVRRA